MRVRGDSMIDAGIFNGDLAFIKRLMTIRVAKFMQ
nr:MAG TPA: LexA repressor [Caudoviricetes sp.]